MKDPKRLIEECGSELEWALLQEGRRSIADETRRLKVLSALGAGTAVAVTSKTGWAFATTWKKVMLGGLAVCAGIGGSVLAARSGVSSAEAPALTVAPSVVSQPRLVSQAESQAAANAGAVQLAPKAAEVAELGAAKEVTPMIAVAPLGANPGQRTASAKTSRALDGARVTATPSSSLAQEVAIIDRARSAVRAGHGVEALGQVEDYLRDFPKGGLRLEAEVVRVQALASLGKRAEASARAKKLLSRNPNSVLAGRLRGYVTE